MDVHGVVRIFRRAFDAILDAVIPPRERVVRTKARTLDDIPLSPVVHQLLGKEVTTIMRYQEPAVQDLIRSLKYDGSLAAATLAATALSDYLREEIANEKAFSPREIFLVPIPLHNVRKRERGFNQIEIVLDALPKEFKDGTVSRLAPELLVRVRETRSQTHLPRMQRLKNVTGAFSATRVLKNVHVFLVDDVTTTGATLASAGRTLGKAGAKVSLIALARA